MTTWQKKWKENHNKIDSLAKLQSTEDLKILETIAERHPVSIPDYYFNLIDQNDPLDPIRLLSYPSVFEADLAGDYDTSGESENTKMPGLQHKYGPTALVLTTNACFMYCRHCFRKRMVGYSHDEINRRMDESVEYISSHEEINNVLLSGGDSLCMSNRQIEAYLKNLSGIDHLNFIRFGTRTPVVFPERIYGDEELLLMLKKYNQQKRIVFITQFNHPKELTSEATKSIRALQNIGITVNNQAVVLKNINDKPEIMIELLNGLMELGIDPYYVFHCRPVKAVKTGFQLSIIETYRLMEATRPHLSGLSKRFRLIMSHIRGKIEIMAADEENIYFKFHQAKAVEDNERMFVRKIDPKGKWLDGDLQFIE
jgi:KamA family protein